MPVPPRPAPAVLSAVLALALAAGVSACSGSVDRDDVRAAEGTITGLTVTGEPGAAPAVRMAAPLKVTGTRTETVVAGTGAPVQVDQLFVLQLTMYDARTGKKAISTYDPGQVPMAVKNTDDTLFPALSKALVGQRQGSRLVLTVTGDDAYGDAGAPQYGIDPGDPVVLVADVVAVPPTEVLPALGSQGLGADPAGRALPRVVERDGLPDRIDTSGVAKPGRLVVVPLVTGTGPAVRDDSLVTVDYLGQVWGAAYPFEDTFTKEPALVPIGVDAVTEAWDRALVGVRRGSRLLVLAPPRLSFKAAGSPPAIPGSATIAYVIDVLGVS
ncbi:FKBP-type peptidyl-prolyl cis-trans isomerase [Marmoricola sp. RAF53]|uniref:FKBP-type peptidyl-prolyl cis-trans isomerase n=1 Tax=Marmoricola sp. RAF53 TaxID=3233059 RepID=UPI003F9DCC8B